MSSNKKDEQWFLDRVGKTIHASSEKGYTGPMEIQNETHAKYLCNFSQERQGYLFTDLEAKGLEMENITGIQILNTDRCFATSPDAGDPRCLCSRCGNRIGENKVCIRCWPDDEERKIVGDVEWRFCDACLAAMGVHHSASRVEYNEDDDSWHP